MGSIYSKSDANDTDASAMYEVVSLNQANVNAVGELTAIMFFGKTIEMQ